MSYRLIDANALEMSRAEVNDMPCIYADLPNGLDGGYYDMTQSNTGKSRWHELFGTPERAARTLENGTPMCDWCDTQACDKRGGECSLFDYNVLLEWLRGESE